MFTPQQLSDTEVKLTNQEWVREVCTSLQSSQDPRNSREVSWGRQPSLCICREKARESVSPMSCGALQKRKPASDQPITEPAAMIYTGQPPKTQYRLGKQKRGLQSIQTEHTQEL